MDTLTGLLLIHATSTWAMLGLIWFVQVVHYPLVLGDSLALMGPEDAIRLEREHMRRTTFVVAPLMALEATSTAGLLLLAPGVWTILGAVLLAVVWASTAFVQVPCHKQLESGFDEAAAARLVRSNRWRTAAWTGRALVAGILILYPSSPAPTGI